MSKSFENNRLLLRNIISIIWRFNAIIPKLVIYKVAKSNFEYILIKKKIHNYTDQNSPSLNHFLINTN
jgi:hypothetical protein